MHRNGFAAPLLRVANNGYNHQQYNNNLHRQYPNGNGNYHQNGNNHHQQHSHRRRTVSSGETENGHPIYRDQNGKLNGRHHHHSDDMKKDALKVKSVEKANRNLNEYRKEGKFCDFELHVSGKVFPVHKVILSASSGYFEVLFNNKENFIENAKNTVDLKEEVDSSTLEMLLSYIYTGEINVNSHNVQDIARVSNIFELMELVEYCSKFLESNIDVGNCIGILRFADFYGFQELYFEAKHFVERKFAEVCKEEEFLELSPKLLKSFLRSESLSIDSEYQVLSCTLKWILKDECGRLEYLAEFINLIRMPLIPPEKIKNFAESCTHAEILKALAPYFTSDAKATDTSMEVAETTNNPGYNFIRLQPRMCSRRRIYVLGGLNIRFNDRQSPCTLHTMVKLNMHTGSWDYESPFFYPRSSHCVVLLNGKLYLIGGECDSLILDTMEIYDPESQPPDNWIKGSSMNHPRSAFGACAHGKYIYVFGGKGNYSSRTIERYDPTKNQWTFFANMPLPRFGMQVVEHDGLIYIIGGRFNNQALDTLMSFNPDSGEFKCLAPMNIPRSEFGCTVLHGHIYVIGGVDSSNEPSPTVEQYNITENKWSYLAPLKARRSALSALSFNNLIYTFGGRQMNAPRGLKNVDIYDPDLDQWFNSGNPMPQNRTEAAVVLV